ncbi:hypothetical protein MHK_002082, partial [Candidatus Magnetomorum sp. HK-1]
NNPPSDNLTIAFDFSDSGINESAENPDDYTLLYRSNTNDNFSAIQGLSVIKNGDRILFQVSDTDLQDGYYTIGTKKGAPIISDISTQTAPAGTSVSIPMTITDADNAPCSIDLTITSSNETLIPVQNISYTCNAGTYMISLTPASTQFGTSTISITVTDSEGLSSSTHFIVAFSPPGSGNALYLDGVDDYIALQQNYTWPDTFSIMAWIHVKSYSNESAILSAGKIAGSSITNSAEFRLYNDHLQYGQFYDSTWHSVTSNEALETDKWYHVAVVKNYTSVSLYINGKPDNTGSMSGISCLVNVAIGGFLSSGSPYGNYYFDGYIDEVSFWSIPLTLQNIRDNMCKRMSSDSNMISYYRFDYSTGNTLADLSGNGNHGILQNMTNDDWVRSGAALGDVSVYDYTGSVSTDFEVNISHSDGDSLTVTGENGSYTGIHAYLLNEAPSNQSLQNGLNSISSNYYWGIFPVGINPEFSITHNYNDHAAIVNNDELSLVERSNNADSSWSELTGTHNTTSNLFNITGLTRNEIYLVEKSGTITVSNSTVTMNEDTVLNSMSFTVSHESNPCALSISFESSNLDVVAIDNISYTCDSGVFYLSITPSTNQYGSATINVTISDSYNLTATSSFDLTVTNINDIPRIISNQSFDVNENSSMGRFVGRIEANDHADSYTILTYAIDSALPSNPFGITASTGEIFLNGNLDFESVNSYTLTISVADEYSSSTETVLVNILDKNDNLSGAGRALSFDGVDDYVDTGEEVGFRSTQGTWEAWFYAKT